jgi:nucleoside deoxyribosyltransferase
MNIPELLKDKEWANATYKGDCVGVATSDVCLVTYIPEEEDVGVGVELGMAEALGKYIVIVIPDEDWGKPINLMTYGIAHNFIKQSELAKFDFNKPTFNYYEGDVY